MKEGVALYFKELNKYKSFTYIVQCAVIFSAILSIIDILDIPSHIIDRIPVDISGIISFLIVFIIVSWLVNIRFFDLLKIPSINIIDIIIIFVLFLTGICSMIWGFLLNQYLYKFIVAVIIFVLFVIMCLIRVLFYTKNFNAMKKVIANIYDLKVIYEGRFKSYKGEPILIAERDVDYDILKREGLINQLYMSIVKCKSYSSFVIGLEGEWGSGKTTIINNVKCKLRENDADNIIIIDDFDPWLFGTQEALLLAMYDTILQKTGIRFSMYYRHKVMKSLSKTITDNYSVGGILQDLLTKQSSGYNETKEIKEQLANYLTSINRYVVFFIDNIDRAEAENIIFLFKLIGTMFDLPKIIYVLSYDRERVMDILSDATKINPRYMEKIIQQEVKVPSVQKEQLVEVYTNCIYNILMHYGILERELIEFKSLIELVCIEVTELRRFKRLINSAFVSTFCQDNILYKKNLLEIEVIRFLEPELYYHIKANKKFFVSHDRIIDKTLYYETIEKKAFNVEGKAFFEGLLNKYGQYKDLLAEMFPYVKRFVDNHELLAEYIYSDSDYEEVSRNTRICSGKYFDLYFSYGSNVYLQIGKDISTMLVNVDKADSEHLIYKNICEKILEVPISNQKEWFERLQNYLRLIPLKSKPFFAEAIFDSLDVINSSQVFMGINARNRALLDIELLLEECEVNSIIDFVQKIKLEYGKLDAISYLLYWFKHTKSENPEDVKVKEEIIKQEFIRMCKEVIEEKINIYSDTYYRRYNVWGLVRLLDELRWEERIFHQYIESVLNENTVFRIIGDLISQSMGMQYGYCIKDDNLRIFFENESVLEKVLEKVSPNTVSEEFVLKVYQKYKSNEVNEWGEKQITSQAEVELKL